MMAEVGEGSEAGPYEAKISDVENELREIISPYQVGIQLDISREILDAIEKNHHGDVGQQRSKVIGKWYSSPGDHTWEVLANAIERIGGHGRLVEKLRRKHEALKNTATKVTKSSASGSFSQDSGVLEFTASKNMEANERVGSFSDDFSPKKVCDWLAATLEAKGLKLKEEQRKIFMDEEINGEAFRELTETQLQKMGFKMGPIINIMKIISSLPAKVESPKEEPDGSSTPTIPSYPASGCTMSFSPKTTPASSSSPSEGGAPACMPFKGNLWRKERLVVELHHEKYLKDWGMTTDTFFECANRWSTGYVKGGNYIPKFVLKEDNSTADIIVELNNEADDIIAVLQSHWSAKILAHGTKIEYVDYFFRGHEMCLEIKKRETDHIGYVDGLTTKIFLDLGHGDQTYREHLIGHEFGHALGLCHEHQRSNLWRLIDNFIDKDKMKRDLRDRYGDWKEDEHVDDGESTDYDPESIMHYWFAPKWLKVGYRDKDAIMRDKALSEDAKRALLGVLIRGNVAICPSKVDLEFLSDQYKSARGVLDMSQVACKNDVSPARGSGPASKRIRTDFGSDVSPATKKRRVDSGSDIQGSKGGKNTREYKNVKKNFPKLSDSIARVIGSVCEQLLAEDLITSNEKDKACNGAIEAKNRASDLVSSILNKVNLDPENYETFIGILKQDLVTFRAVLKDMGINISDHDE